MLTNYEDTSVNLEWIIIKQHVQLLTAVNGVPIPYILVECNNFPLLKLIAEGVKEQ